MQRPDAHSDLAYNAAEFCSTKDAARLLGVSHRTVQLWVENGALQAWKTAGGHRRITMTSVHKLVNERREVTGAAPIAQEAAPSAPSRKKLLLVDDDRTLLRLYELEIAGWNLPLTLVKAPDGFEALLRIGEQRPDVLVSDLSMPGMDGFRMIRTLRADPLLANMAIIVVSGLDRPTIDSMGLPGDIPVFPKPVPFGQLRAAVEDAIGMPAAA
ncbi:response regulator [Massilia sp. Leaf139]|uniref:response regulator n=1 Tax=Massilia sp. Leaf139 TaxID=1736272 RepID=UPI0006F6D653|nr:response regulator [Massilia sp. Leaf139]KQQ97319.1 excisionase [Massilia sp. Leaf139]